MKKENKIENNNVAETMNQPISYSDSGLGRMMAQKAAEKKAEEEAAILKWSDGEEAAVKAPLPKLTTSVEIAKQIRAGGYPKTLIFGGMSLTVYDENDLQRFWKTVFSNLTKDEYKGLGKQPLSEHQISAAMYRFSQRIKAADDLIANGLDKGAIEFESEGVLYILAGGVVINLDSKIICDVSDIEAPFGPSEWAEVTNRIHAATLSDPEEEEEEEKEEEEEE